MKAIIGAVSITHSWKTWGNYVQVPLHDFYFKHYKLHDGVHHNRKKKWGSTNGNLDLWKQLNTMFCKELDNATQINSFIQCRKL